MAASAIDFERLVSEAPDALILASREGLIVAWNAAAERIFGFAAAAALGQSLDLIIPEAFRENHRRGFDRALADGDTKYRGQVLPTRATRADGADFYVELSFSMLHDAGGAVTGVIAQARDITERFERDRTMRRRLRDLEQAVPAAS